MNQLLGAGLSRASVAGALGVAPSTVSKYAAREGYGTRRWSRPGETRAAVERLMAKATLVQASPLSSV